MDILSLIFSVNMLLRPLKIAVIDTGYGVTEVFKKCPGAKDFTDSSVIDTNGHGTNVIGIISSRLEGFNYCILPIKVFGGPETTESLIAEGIKYAVSMNVDIINISGGGGGKDNDEEYAVNLALNNNIKLIVSAGNDGHNLDSSCNYFPACYNSRVQVVGSIQKNGNLSKFSNFGGVVKYWQHGEKVEGGGVTMSGTSQATAIQTAMEAKRMLLNNKNR